MPQLVQYGLDIGEILSVTGDDVAFVIKGVGYWWRGRVGVWHNYSNNLSMSANLWREMRPEGGQLFEITTGMSDGKTLYFNTAHHAGKLQSMKAELPERKAKRAPY